MKLVGLVFLGLVASVIISQILVLLIMKTCPAMSGGGDAYMWVPILITVPVALIMGSFFTGYFSYDELDSKWALLWLAPGLYSNILFMCMVGISFFFEWFASGKTLTSVVLNGIFIPLLIGLYWYLASLAGVGLGYFLKGRITR